MSYGKSCPWPDGCYTSNVCWLTRRNLVQSQDWSKAIEGEVKTVCSLFQLPLRKKRPEVWRWRAVKWQGGAMTDSLPTFQSSTWLFWNAQKNGVFRRRAYVIQISRLFDAYKIHFPVCSVNVWPRAWVALVWYNDQHMGWRIKAILSNACKISRVNKPNERSTLGSQLWITID